MSPRLPPVFLGAPLAHRALHGPGAPENSRAAIQAAIQAGYGIEIDLQLSADGVAIVFHDDSLDRLTAKKGPVRHRTAAELNAIALNGGTEGIPTLSDILVLVAGQVPLLIEMKDQDGGMGPNIGALEAATAAALDGYDGPAALMSFNPHSVAEAARLCPTRPRGLTTCGFEAAHWPLPALRRAELRDIPDYDRTGSSFISHNAADLANPRVADLKAQGADVLCWTIRSPAAEADARKIAQNITFEGYRADIAG